MYIYVCIYIHIYTCIYTYHILNSRHPLPLKIICLKLTDLAIRAFIGVEVI